MISQSYFQNISNDVGDYGDELTEKTLKELRKIANRTIKDPSYDFRSRWNQFIDKRNELFVQRATEALSIIIAQSYLKALKTVDGDLFAILSSPNPPNGVIPPNIFTSGRGNLSQEARKILKDYPKHWTALGVMEQSARNELTRTFLPIFRSQQDMIRQIQALSLTAEFRDAPFATRITLAQRLMDDFANKGITGITYSNGARHSIDNYSKQVARTAVQQAANQASFNRLSERGYDLIRVNQYAGASDLCAPYQGGVYSISGNSTKYPSLESVIFNGSTGIYHMNCGHSQSAYIEGLSEPLGKLSTEPLEQNILNEMGEAEGNRFIYEQRQVQRKIERNIRKYKYRSASSLDADERARAKRYVSKWQGEMRTHLDKHTFLRRRRDSEQI